MHRTLQLTDVISFDEDAGMEPPNLMASLRVRSALMGKLG